MARNKNTRPRDFITPPGRDEQRRTKQYDGWRRILSAGEHELGQPKITQGQTPSLYRRAKLAKVFVIPTWFWERNAALRWQTSLWPTPLRYRARSTRSWELFHQHASPAAGT